jgi:hypothetical protein
VNYPGPNGYEKCIDPYCPARWGSAEHGHQPVKLSDLKTADQVRREVMDRSTEEARSVRYYTYSLASGRRRVPDEWSTNEHDAISWASVMFASGLPDNVTSEEGPVGKPTSTHVIWQRSPSPAPVLQHVVVALLENEYSTPLIATGSTPAEALDRVMDAWRELARQYHLDPDLMHDEDVVIAEGPLGSAFLGSQPL